jgi:hypothetical protein
MNTVGFSSPISLTGPVRSPHQMLGDQEYDGHSSIHDDETADKLGLRGAPIEGPTHFSQFDPLGVALFGEEWFEHGCISAHFENMVIEGEQVQAFATRESADRARIHATKDDGASVLTGTLTLGNGSTPLLEERLTAMNAKDMGELFIVDQLVVGAKTQPRSTSMQFSERNGNLYPFSLEEKLRHITEPSPWYHPDTAAASPWGRAIIPTEMVSVLVHKDGTAASQVFPVRGPALGLFVDLQVRYVNGPLFVGETYNVVHEIVGVGQSRRVESYWTRTQIMNDASTQIVAEVLLHQGVFKASYEKYPEGRL